ncbi:MAG: hypothetical protein QXP81_10280 [Nitrososphaerota archaeon]
MARCAFCEEKFQRRLLLLDKILDELSSRPTIILDKPLVAGVLRRYQRGLGRTPEELAEEIIKEKWGKKLATGIVDKMIAEAVKLGANIPPETAEYLKEAWARIVTRGLME